MLCCFVFIQKMFSQAPSEVKIGTQIWTTKNLDVSTFRNGEAILEAKNKEEWVKTGENETLQSYPKNSQNNIPVTDQFMNYLMRSNWIVTEYTPSFAKSMYGAKCKFTKNGFSYVPRYNGVYLDEVKYKFDIISIQENIPEGSKYSGAFNFYNLQQKNDTQKHAFLYLKEDVVLWKYGFNGYTINLVLTRMQ